MKKNYEKILNFENPFLDYNISELVEFYKEYKDIQDLGWCSNTNSLRDYLTYYNYKNYGGLNNMCRQLLEAIAEKVLLISENIAAENEN